MKPEEDIPPAAVCAHCGQPDCEGGCVSFRPVLAAIPWERRRSAGALWETCVYLAEPPEQWLSKVLAGSLGRALQFAVLVETCAVASYVLPTLAVAALTLHAFDLPPSLLGSVAGWLGACLGVGAFMVALHVMWALFVESLLALSGLPPSWRRSCLLTVYSCAWDLLTSPAGVAAAWIAGRRSEVARLLGQALRNPRAASTAYLMRERQQTPARSALLAGSAALLTVACGLTVGALTLWWFWARQWNQPGPWYLIE